MRYHRGMIRWTWTQTAKGNWICLSGSYTAVAEWQGTWWEIRVKTKGGISSTTHRATSPAELESFMQRLIQDLAKQAREMQLLDSGPARLGWM
ncbi:MAG: hypothetical protein M3R24_13785 [Chloroflexota bacterium]|nr:hypothetical protein [Chloroflexota bacterium]